MQSSRLKFEAKEKYTFEDLADDILAFFRRIFTR
jgi:hypothetical protein